MTQRTSWPRAALLALALTSVLASPAGATGSAVYDAGPVAIPKTDYQVNPNIPSNEKIVAADWNQFGQYLLDCGTAVRWGYYHGFAPQLAAPLPPDSGVILFNLQDGGGFWLEYPDAGAQQVVLTLAGMATIPSIDAGSILTGTLTAGSETVTGTGAAGFEYTAPHIIATTDLASAATLESSGKATLDSLYVPGATILDGGAVASVVTAAQATTLTLKGTQADGASAVGSVHDTSTLYSNGGAKLVSFRNNGSEKSYIDANGNLLSSSVAQGSFDSEMFSGFMPVPALGANVDFAGFSDQNPRGVATFHMMTVATTAAGTGGTSFVVSLRDTSSSVNLCSLTVSCASAAGTITTSIDCATSPSGTNHAFTYRVSSSTCTTLPTFNVSTSFTHP